MTRALSIHISNPVRAFVLASLLVLAFGAMPFTARAAVLSETQISSILLLLSSFGAEREMVSAIESTMRAYQSNSGSSDSNTGSRAPEARLQASPSSGRAPLTTTFTIQVYDGGNFSLDYGDGTGEAIAVPAVQCVIAPCYPPSFTKTHTYEQDGSYTALLTGRSGSVLASKSIKVSGSSAVPAATDPVVISSFKVSTSSIVLGKKVSFSWKSNMTSKDIQNHLAFCSIEGLTPSNRALQVAFRNQVNGEATYAPTETATYTLKCSSSAKEGGSYDQEQVTVTVAAKKPTCKIHVSKDTVRMGESVTFTWMSTDASSISGLGENGLPPQGALTFTPSSVGKETYTLTAEGPGGTATCKKEIKVKTSVSFGPLEFLQAYSEAFDQNLAASIGAMVYMPESLYETMSGVPDMLAALGMVPGKAMAASLSEALYQTGLY